MGDISQQEVVSSPENITEAAGKADRIRRVIGLGLNQRAREAAESVRKIRDKGSSTATSGITRVTRTADAVTGVVLEGSQRVRDQTNAAKEAVRDAHRQATTATGDILQGIGQDPEVQKAIETIRQQGLPLALEAALIAVELGGLPMEQIAALSPRAARIVELAARHLPRVMAAAERLGIVKEEQGEKTDDKGLSKRAMELGIDMVLPPQIAAAKKAMSAKNRAVRIGGALGIIGKRVLQEVREYNQHPEIIEAMQAFDEQPPQMTMPITNTNIPSI